MLPWWVWLLLWTALVLALLVVVGALLWRSFRKFLGMVEATGELADQLGTLDIPEPVLDKPELAVLAVARDIRDREDARRARRSELRRSRHERRMARARRITRVDATSTMWPPDWYR
ncbi:uncharacterized protein (DUF58 family) [Microbacteriaceae bacterium SG_E_30_P1]|uniref:Uncharacterized protein (DUF58 family) n=1 Tax=Antiquaquibacter oligotrophicus TaxID=2880260 RepID=A0ABT6KNX3_9MICO|nr:hypothetical protein [Antiquaquibacter oligotrophicus]MDH6180864.1 uncharacterized protein (DUF58 family) [Antiquaquibacter oligotrophicus]UDF13423.1 hypothetical protein LH407_00760 [Antiquaquibacter oligotrophicus]